MKQFKVPNEYASDSFLTDDHLSLSAKGFLMLDFLGYFDNPYDATKFCNDDFVEVENIIHELRKELKKYKMFKESWYTFGDKEPIGTHKMETGKIDIVKRQVLKELYFMILDIVVQVL